MGIIRIYEKAGKQKRKPGWQKAEAEHQKWLDSMKSMQSGFKTKAGFKPTKLIVTKPDRAPPRILDNTTSGLHPHHTTPYTKYVVGGGTKPVPRPEITYQDDPEMLERELKARERKFNVAPAYNKGGAMLMTEDMMEDLKKGLLRRR